jgi:PST family polysaccharide transporter
LALLPFLLWLSASPGVIVWLSLAQSLAAVKLSHAMAEAPWRLALDRQRLRRFLAFGWPIWLSAFPLMIVYQADRVLVGRAYGMEALAAYSAAFMVTMVPGLVAAKVGHALMLPLLAEKRAEPRAFADRYRLMCETTVVMSAAYLVVFILIGGLMLPLAFGPNYRGLETVIAWLALMWAVRMIQAPAGMALMALGDNRPLLWAGLIRAAALPFAVAAAALSLGIEGIAAAGVIGEVASLGYVAIAAGGAAPGLARITIGRALALMPLGAAALLLSAQMPQAQLTVSGLAAATGAGLAVMLLAAAALPSLRRSVREWLGPRAVALTASVPSAPRP